MSKKKENLYALAEAAMMAALSVVLYLISDFIPWPAFLQGGSITLFGQVPIIILSYRRGIKYGLSAALVLGVFELIMGLANFAYVKTLGAYIVVALFDYIIAFGVLGLGGILRNTKLNDKASVAIGAVIVSFLKFACHFISGVTVWRDYTQSLTASIIYSVTYNGSYMLPETIITLVGCSVAMLFVKKKRT